MSVLARGGAGPAWTVRFVCTDRGTHPSRELAEVFRYHEKPALLAELVEHHGERRARELYDAGMFGYSHGRAARRGGSVGWTVVNSTPTTPDDPRDVEDTWRLCCPTCSRDLQLSGEHMREVATRLHDAGVTSADISLLDAML